MLSLLKRLNTLLFISAKLLDTSRANNALLWETIQVDKAIPWANRMNEWKSMNSQGTKTIKLRELLNIDMSNTVTSYEIRILDEAIANASSDMNLHSQYFKLSGGQLARPSAVLNNVCITSPPKFWNSLSNICHKKQVVINTTTNLHYNMRKHISRKYRCFTLHST